MFRLIFQSFWQECLTHITTTPSLILNRRRGKGQRGTEVTGEGSTKQDPNSRTTYLNLDFTDDWLQQSINLLRWRAIQISLSGQGHGSWVNSFIAPSMHARPAFLMYDELYSGKFYDIVSSNFFWRQ